MGLWGVGGGDETFDRASSSSSSSPTSFLLAHKTNNLYHLRDVAVAVAAAAVGRSLALVSGLPSPRLIGQVSVRISLSPRRFGAVGIVVFLGETGVGAAAVAVDLCLSVEIEGCFDARLLAEPTRQFAQAELNG